MKNFKVDSRADLTNTTYYPSYCMSNDSDTSEVVSEVIRRYDTTVLKK